MEIVEKVKLLLDNPSISHSLLDMLVEDAKVEAVDYCNLIAYDTTLDSTVVKMVIQNYNKSKSQGISSQTYSGVQETFKDGYSADVLASLNKHRKVRFL